ncbi:MAG: AAA family ATPase, partial [Gammaproteobacteria bacterium]|nr:AAA family ATPase [Gammaproteobacteria bacterium]
DFLQPVEGGGLEEYRECWDQELPSETPGVYRSEYLAASMLFDAEEGVEELTMQSLLDATRDEGGLLEAVRRYAAPRYDEGYERGVHDADGTVILGHLLDLYSKAGLLRYAARCRTLAVLFWAFYRDRGRIEHWERVGKSLGQLAETFSQTGGGTHLAAELGEVMGEFFAEQQIEAGQGDLALAGRYLVEELKRRPMSFTTATAARTLAERLLSHLENSGQRAEFEDDLGHLDGHLGRQYRLARAWISAFTQWNVQRSGAEPTEEGTIVEAIGILLTAGQMERTETSAGTRAEAAGLFGQHPLIKDRRLEIRLDEFLTRLHEFRAQRVPRYRAYRETRQRVIETEREALRLEEFKPQALTTFVRNRLIDQVYLPLVGDNLAKQMGALGAGKRTDQMGMLLLISPPGYGKTTLMEYMANRLGLVFMKINCPAVGHDTTAIDPG